MVGVVVVTGPLVIVVVVVVKCQKTSRITLCFKILMWRAVTDGWSKGWYMNRAGQQKFKLLPWKQTKWGHIRNNLTKPRRYNFKDSPEKSKCPKVVKDVHHHSNVFVLLNTCATWRFGHSMPYGQMDTCCCFSCFKKSKIIIANKMESLLFETYYRCNSRNLAIQHFQAKFLHSCLFTLKFKLQARHRLLFLFPSSSLLKRAE